ncbi:uncharacterized protein [Watersipora subatra]|uniref:uncharacterized protein n=1 Tax=Watersipora subatra TaxID=2589382 RepID=UPI00355BB950
MGPKRGESASHSGYQITLASIDLKLTQLIMDVAKIHKRLDLIENKQAEYELSLENFQEEINDVKSKVSELESAKTKRQQSTTHNNLLMHVEANEHLNRAKAIELNGIPFKSGENLMEGFSKLLKVAKLDDINPTRDIDNIYRIRQTPRILVKFIQTTKRDQFFQLYRRNIIDTSLLGFQEKNRIYINEVLSREQNELFWKAQKFKTNKNFRFIWTFNQRIYLRKTPESDAVQIRTQSDLDDLEASQ